jgi:hypothetical protein
MWHVACGKGIAKSAEGTAKDRMELSSLKDKGKRSKAKGKRIKE